jgi:hypothetical protein
MRLAIRKNINYLAECESCHSPILIGERYVVIRGRVAPHDNAIFRGDSVEVICIECLDKMQKEGKLHE